MVTNWVQRRGSSERDIERRTRQIKEIVRLGTTMRAEMRLDEILRQVVESISGALGFNVAVINLIFPDRERVEIAASVGLSEAERVRLAQNPPIAARLLSVMRPEFCISKSYFISHNYKHLFEGVEGVTVYTPMPPNAQRPPDAWHPEDALLVPLVSPGEDRLLGILSLDQPEDGKAPTLETIEIIELFASQTALAIDTARLFQEREMERRALESGLFELLFQLEQVRQGYLDVRVQLGGSALRPIADSLQAVLYSLNSLLAEVRTASEVVNANAGEMRGAAIALAESAQRQAHHILEVSRAVEGMAASVSDIAGIAQGASTVAQEAIEISNVGREAAEHATEGMHAVREMALQSVKKIKRLGENAQDIGEIVQMVSDFAGQTNLLALNAAIEASRAGEHGRGFATIAQEIRTLANSSTEAAKQIHTRIKSIQSDINGVAVAIEHSTQQVVLQSEFAAQAGSALEAVDVVTQRIARSIRKMNDTATQQAGTATVVSRSIAEIAQVTAQTRDSMEQMRASMDPLVELAQSLLGAVSVFRLAEGAQPPGPTLLEAGERPPYEMSTQPMPALNASLFGHPDQTGAMARPGVSKGAQTRVLPRGTTPLLPSSSFPSVTSGPLPPSSSFPSMTSGPLSSGSLDGSRYGQSGPLSNPRASHPSNARMYPRPTQYSDPGAEE